MACIIPFVPPLRMSKARHVRLYHRHDQARRFFLQFLFFLFYRIIYGITPLPFSLLYISNQIKRNTHTHTHTHTHTPRMGFSISRQTIELTLLLSFAFLSLVFAVFFEQNNETSMTDEADGGLYQTASSKFRIALLYVLTLLLYVTSVQSLLYLFIYLFVISE